jgi:hypothetical protein
MTQRVKYTVFATIRSKEVVTEYIEWLNAGHAQALIDLGALSAEVVIVETEEGEDFKVEASYIYPSREALQAYFDGPAATLRVDGKTRWMDTGKITFARSVSTIQFSL